MRLAAAVVIILGAVLTAVGCGGDDDEVSGTTVVGNPELSDRGLIAKQVGESAFVTDRAGKTRMFEFTVDDILADIPCTAEYASGPENGHFIGVRVTLRTTTDFEPGLPINLGPQEFDVVGPDGITDTNLNNGAAYTCLTDNERFTFDTFRPASTYTGTVVLDSRYNTGVLTYSSFFTGDSGWEWTF
jgi:hypothetical protein